MKIPGLLTLLLLLCVPLHAQTIDDGIMMARRSLQAGVIYTHDSWDEYWEGSLERVNGNIGTLTTEASTATAVYGLTDRLTLLGSVPYVWTNPSMGVLQGQQGVQDLTLAGKFSFFERSSASRGALRAIAVVSGSLPLTEYVADFAPLSIGNHSKRISGRLTLNYQTPPGVYLTGSGAYTKRSDVTLDRPYYYTGGQLFFTDQVDMPDVADYIVSVGYLKHDLNANVSFSQQFTQGGADIRRQDMPFVSSRMNFSKVTGMAMYPIPKLRAIAFYVAMTQTVDGRNVGHARTFAGGLLYSYSAQGRLIR